MGLFATLKDHNKCPKCGGKAEWQSKGLWLSYKGMDIWIGEYHNIELDENMSGHIVAYGHPVQIGGCGHITYFKIIRGELIESTEQDHRKLDE